MAWIELHQNNAEAPEDLIMASCHADVTQDSCGITFVIMDVGARQC